METIQKVIHNRHGEYGWMLPLCGVSGAVLSYVGYRLFQDPKEKENQKSRLWLRAIAATALATPILLFPNGVPLNRDSSTMTVVYCFIVGTKSAYMLMFGSHQKPHNHSLWRWLGEFAFYVLPVVPCVRSPASSLVNSKTFPDEKGNVALISSEKHDETSPADNHQEASASNLPSSSSSNISKAQEYSRPRLSAFEILRTCVRDVCLGIGKAALIPLVHRLIVYLCTDVRQARDAALFAAQAADASTIDWFGATLARYLHSCMEGAAFAMLPLCGLYVIDLGSAILRLCSWGRYELLPFNNWPLSSASLREFWGRRYNKTISTFLRELIFDPLYLQARFAPSVASAAAFATSALLHVYCSHHVFNDGRMRSALFFTLQGGLVAAEPWILRGRSRLFGRCYTTSVLFLSLPIYLGLFTERMPLPWYHLNRVACPAWATNMADYLVPSSIPYTPPPPLLM